MAGAVPATGWPLPPCDSRTMAAPRWPGRSAAKDSGVTAIAVAGTSLRRTVWSRSAAFRVTSSFQASTGASRTPIVTTVAIMPAEIIEAKRRSDRRAAVPRAREE